MTGQHAAELGILTCSGMRCAESAAIGSGVAAFDLMRAAGEACVGHILERYSGARRALVLCGSGNNGGDGFVVAAGLRAAGWTVRLACIRVDFAHKGAAGQAQALWAGDVLAFHELETVFPDEIVVDSVFGTGFRGTLGEDVARVFACVREARIPVVAVDIPSGISGDTGAVDPHALSADLTLTFFRKKLGHVLMPGWALCGDVRVCDIGIPAQSLESCGVAAWENHPDLWKDMFYVHKKRRDAHKYAYGHAMILAGSRMTGAAILAARACMRVGAGLCTVVAPESVLPVFQVAVPHVLVEPLDKAFESHLEDPRRKAVLVGSGAGLADEAGLLACVLAACRWAAAGRGVCVLDGDALTVMSRTPESLEALSPACLLTPHEGEFARLFPEACAQQDTKWERLRAAQARAQGAVIVLKGADTLIAGGTTWGAPVVNLSGTPDLATAGTGDVLCGLILGLAARGAAPDVAASIAAWIHGEAARAFGVGLTAPDLPDRVPAVIAGIL